jgi:predicted HTH transcriptional regulator
LLSPKLFFVFYNLQTVRGDVVILELERATDKPVRFQGTEFIRIGSYKKTLKDYPDVERQLWRIFDKIPFERSVAMESVSDTDVLRYLDYPAYFELLDIPLPEDRIRILERLADDQMIRKTDAGKWDVTNLGAILLAKKMSFFQHLQRKTIRLIQYRGISRIETVREWNEEGGYAVQFEHLLETIHHLLPRNEQMGMALRRDVPMYPELAIRELVANAIIHQDFSLRGTGPMIEMFADRMEITNPGDPLIHTERFIDSPPRSRNEAMASFMRRIGVCEERGSGFDKVVSMTELYQLPAPFIEVTSDHTRVVLFAQKSLANMDRDERVRACYMHACLKYVTRSYMTNTSLRERFGLEDEKISMSSRMIRDAIDAGVIKPKDSETAPKHMKYVPYWA